jgi:uncharacterized protein DUF4382
MTVASAVRPILFAGCLVLALACSSGSASVHAGTGTIQVHLTDAPLPDPNIEKVEVTITDVIVYPGGDDSGMPVVDPAGPIVLNTHPETFDLLTLTGGATDLLASGEVPAGEYSRIRLEITDASLTLQDGTVEPLKIDSDKVDVPIRFHVTADAMNAITLDFDAGASVQVNQTATGTYILRPVVTPLPHP